MDQTVGVSTHKVRISVLRTSAEVCSICRLLFQTFQRCGNDNDWIIEMFRTRTSLRLLPGRSRVLRFCQDPEISVRSGISAPISLPILPKCKDDSRLALLRAWLLKCDKSHSCSIRQDKSSIMFPTRVLYVGDNEDPYSDPNCVRLVGAPEAGKQEYVALSHCWGELSDKEKEAYCTTRDNIDQRVEGFNVSGLPKTFQDAIKVTRNLGVQYLWIDSLCIIQYGDSGKDWRSESCRMETVFSHAYCVIAATAAVDSNAGFLKQNAKPDYVYVQNASGQQFYVSTDVDDFDNDVGKARLNTRAWVMQEGVLAQRTVHFSANQMYWECGEGVQCENLTWLKSPRRDKYFMLDPNFPNRLLQSGKKRTINCISFLFQEFSKRSLTIPTDRRIAISGLEARIAGALNCHSRYGTLEMYLHRNLLWQASNNYLTEIMYDYHVPSWSWMAYSGGIQYLGVYFGAVDWFDHLRFDIECECDHAIITSIWTFQSWPIVLYEAQHAVLDPDRARKGWIRYDMESGKDSCEKRCIVVGRTREDVEKYYVLVVRSTSVIGEYRRLGIGLIQCEFVVRQTIDIRVV